MRLAVVLRDGGQLVSTIGLNAISPQHRTAEIAYDLSPAVWGQGWPRPSWTPPSRTGPSCAWACCVSRRPCWKAMRSLRVLERCAFEREGYLRSYRQIRGRSGNFWLYARLAGVP
jgi:RimJ/RimL family protein N-acetyltransferase